jgi:hypothetical protein
VEDGRPFCPQCHAPQIKVPLRPPSAAVTETVAPETPAELETAAEPIPREHNVTATAAAEQFGRPPENRLMRRQAFSSALVAGMLAAVGTSIPIIPLAMLCMFASGGLAVTLYRRRVGHLRVTRWMGARLGLLAGGLGFGLLALMSTLRLFAASERTQLRTAFREKMQEAVASAADPQVRQTMEQLRSYIATDHGLILAVLICLAVAAVVFLLFSALGGALGAALFGRESGRKER